MGEIITATGSLLITIATVVITTIKNKKAGKTKTEAEKKVETTKIIQKLPSFIKEAEKVLGSGTGLAKKQYVLNNVQVECLKANIEYKNDEWDYEVEEILSTPQKKENG